MVLITYCGNVKIISIHYMYPTVNQSRNIFVCASTCSKNGSCDAFRYDTTGGGVCEVAEVNMANLLVSNLHINCA